MVHPHPANNVHFDRGPWFIRTRTTTSDLTSQRPSMSADDPSRTPRAASTTQSIRCHRHVGVRSSLTGRDRCDTFVDYSQPCGVIGTCDRGGYPAPLPHRTLSFRLNAMDPSRRDRMIIARHGSAGIRPQNQNPSPVGTARSLFPIVIPCAHRVGGGLTPSVVPHHQTYGSVSGGSVNLLLGYTNRCQQ